MCGIIGYISFNQNSLSPELLERMTNVLKHRGPDDEGYVLLNNRGFEEYMGLGSVDSYKDLPYIRDASGNYYAGLGYRRLAIIDPSPAGHQPMMDNERKYAIVFNGEVYNYRELRRGLEGKYDFKSNTDTEVVLYSIKEWGIREALDRFIGMYSLLILDSEKRLLYGARDRFGIKPLFYMGKEGLYLFSSEIKALTSFSSLKPNMERIYQYLTFQRAPVSNNTFFKDIFQLEPGHYFVLTGNGFRKYRYWRPSYSQKLYINNTDFNNYINTWRMGFYESTAIHLRTDVPLGFAISGGVDSSSLIAVSLDLLRKGKVREKGLDPTKIYTFSCIIDDPKIGEGKYVHELIEYFNVELKSVYPSPEDIKRELRRFIYYQEEPPESASTFLHWMLVEEASKYVTVLIDGQGGDELLGGYHAYIPIYLKGLIKRGRILEAFKEAWRLRDLIISKLSLGLRVFIGRRKRLVLNILSKEFVEKYGVDVSEKVKSNTLNEALWRDLTGGRLHEILRNEDRNSMAFSLEIRVPYVNHILAELLLSMPENVKIRDGWTKYIHREAMKDLLPDMIRLRRTKIGFEAPESRWLKDLDSYVLAAFKDLYLSELGIVDKHILIKYFRRFLDGKLSNEYSRLFWRILFLEIWGRVYLKRDYTVGS